ncbi:abc transporter sugar permease protein, partial [mine drainage metagenome]
HITLPMLGPTLMTVGLLTMVGYFQLFAEPYVMTQGGPLQSTLSVLYLLYEQGFNWWNLGFASAIAFVLFVFTMIATWVLMRFGRRKGWV